MTYRTCEENAILLNRLEKVHKGFKTKLGVKNKNRKWAVWELGGALLGLAFRAIQYQKEQNDILPIAMLLRLSSEFLNQVAYFADPNTKVSAVKKWYKVYFYSQDLESISYTGFKKRPAEDSHDRAKKLPEGVDFSVGAYSKEINGLLSLWLHPSFDLTRRIFETDRNNGSYELYDFREPVYIDSVASSEVDLILKCSAWSLHIGSYLFGSPIALDNLLSAK